MKTAIVGGGVGGIMAALFLVKEGFDVTIYEKEERLGGRLTFVEKDGYKIDKGPTIVLLPEMLSELLFQAGIQEDEYSLQRCDPLYDIHFANGETYTKHASVDQQVKEIQKKYPGNEEGFKRFMEDMKERFELGKPQFLQESFVKKINLIKPKTISALYKLKAFQSVSKQLENYFTAEELRIAYALQTLYIGGNPYETPAIYSLVSYSEHEHGIYYLEGGYASLIEVLEKACERKGINIVKNAYVSNIIKNQDVATGLVVNDEIIAANSIILNGDLPVVQRLVSINKPYVPSSSCLLLYMGIDGIYENASLHQFYMSTSFKETMIDVFKNKQIPINPCYYVFHPSLVDSTLAPDGKGVLYTLVPVPSAGVVDWDIEKDLLAERIITSMEKNGFPELKKRIDWIEIRSPKEAMAEGLFQGGSFGIAPVLGQSGPFRPQLQPFKEKNIFAVGASIHPGGGIPIVMQGAKLLSEYMINEYATHSSGKEVTIHENISGLRTM
ncbi:phytoene desaturase family protein [Bacillus sp. 2205SS5-2]|uniref:phytoene desaturase family protein n=1 Tax=Bacillus sp. 2205SS5-2 TaxID=3109031 RepID=UPI003005A037